MRYRKFWVCCCTVASAARADVELDIANVGDVIAGAILFGLPRDGCETFVSPESAIFNALDYLHDKPTDEAEFTEVSIALEALGLETWEAWQKILDEGDTNG